MSKDAGASCPDCAHDPTLRSGKWRCPNCHASGIEFAGELIVQMRYLTRSDALLGYRPNPHHPAVKEAMGAS